MEVLKIQSAARNSMEWFENVRRYVHLPPEQFAYARWLDWGTRIGLALLAASFLAYALGVSAPYVPFERLAHIWSLPLDQYRAGRAGPSTGASRPGGIPG